MIVTFYSYKGGVGRSMALANVANWLRLQSLRVLVVDWDLEAPGIESFFVHSEEQRAKVRAAPGVADLVAAYLRKHPTLPPEFFEEDKDGDPVRRLKKCMGVLDDALPALASMALELRPDDQVASSPLPIHLLSPGVREGANATSYARFIQRLDWTSLYERYDGEVFFAWLRAQMETFDIALVDSRTGITEVGGVCTRDLADLVVELCAPNSQNLDGCEMIARSLFSESLAKARDGRKIEVAIVPTRYENAESARLEEFKNEFIGKVSGIYRDFPAAAPGFDAEAMWKLKLQYIARYAYGEALCVNTAGAVEDLERQYESLARFVAAALMRSLAPERSAALAQRSRELRMLVGRSFTLNERMEHAFGALPEESRGAAARVLLRLVGFSGYGERDSAPAAAAKPLSRFPAEEQSLLRAMREQGIVQIAVPRAAADAEAASEEWVALSVPAAIQEWDRLRGWLEADLEFLLWRHRLNGSLAEYQRGGRKDSGLLSGAALKQARGWSERRREAFDAAEVQFIRRSVSNHRLLRAFQGGVAALVVSGIGYNMWGDMQVKKGERLVQEAKTLIAAKDRERGLERLDAAMSVWRPPREGYILRAQLNLERNRPSEALADLSQAVKLDDKDPVALRFLGQAQLAAGNRPPALDAYAKALALRDTDPILWYERGSIYQGAENFAAAVDDYGRALAVKPDYWDARYNRGLSLLRLGRREAAIDDFKSLFAPNVDPVLHAFALARLKELGITEPQMVKASASVKQRLFIHYVNPDDRAMVEELARGLDQGAGGVQSVQFVSRPTMGDVRYFFREDREYALRVKAMAEEKLKSMTGRRVELAVLSLDDKAGMQARPGNVELWLAPLKLAAAK